MNVDDFKIKLLPAKNKLFRIALRLLNDSIEAEDAVQEVYMKLWLKRDEIDEFINPEAFAVTVTKNHCIDKLRTKKYQLDRKSTRLNSSHSDRSRMPSSA